MRFALKIMSFCLGYLLLKRILHIKDVDYTMHPEQMTFCYFHPLSGSFAFLCVKKNLPGHFGFQATVDDMIWKVLIEFLLTENYIVQIE